MSYTPKGPIDGSQPIRIELDKPVVDAAEVGKPVDPHLVLISPDIEWKGFWQDRQTLVIEPTKPLAPSTRYEVSLAGDLASRTDRFSLAFVNKPLALDTSDDKELAPGYAFPVLFNQPVAASDLISHCMLTGPNASTVVPFQEYGNPTSPKHTLTTRMRLDPGGSYELACKDLGGVGGNDYQQITATNHVRAGLTVESFSLAGDAVEPDDAQIVVTFSNPVVLNNSTLTLASTGAPNTGVQ